MFKNSEDEAKFSKVLHTYCSEFNNDNVVVFLPRNTYGLDHSYIPKSVEIKYWRENKYRIGTISNKYSAQYELVPSD